MIVRVKKSTKVQCLEGIRPCQILDSHSTEKKLPGKDKIYLMYWMLELTTAL